MLTLLGPGGIGKSRFLRQLFPHMGHQGFFGQMIDMSADERRWRESLAGRVIVEMPEAVGLNRAEGARLKVMIDQDATYIRMSYDPEPTKFVQSCVPIVTCNEIAIPAGDEALGRRWPVIELEHRMTEQQKADWLDANRDQIWAEARDKARAKDRHGNWLNPHHAEAGSELDELIRTSAEAHEAEDWMRDLAEEIAAQYGGPDWYERAGDLQEKFLERAAKLGQNTPSSKAYGIALRRAGLEPAQKSGIGRIWIRPAPELPIDPPPESPADPPTPAGTVDFAAEIDEEIADIQAEQAADRTGPQRRPSQRRKPKGRNPRAGPGRRR